ncbi:MAG TPA: substrate-binding domain-containing protein, partial [Candidatus Brocadiia bacterium]|nr:substrate-binding domain-containing protein [Candidatus Brocadiia bacterium]
WVSACEGEYSALLAPDAPLSEQACVLIDTLDAGLMSWLQGRGVPYAVQYFRNYDPTQLPEHHSVFINRVKAVFDATNFLLGLGHQRIGFMGPVGEPSSPPDIMPRVGFVSAMQCAGMVVDPAITEFPGSVSDNPEESRDQAVRLLSGPNPPTGIVAQTDADAIGIVLAARSLGLRVPEDLSVVGYNDQEEGRRLDPPLTTFAPPRYEQAVKAVETALAAAEGRLEGFQRIVMSSRLVLRRSAGPAPRRGPGRAAGFPRESGGG